MDETQERVVEQRVNGGHNFRWEDAPIPKRCRSNRTRCSSISSSRQSGQSSEDRRVLRSHYLVIKNMIQEEKEQICSLDSGHFHKIIREVDRLHQLVIKPREQLTDAETLLYMADTLLTSVKSHSQGGLGFTPSDLLTRLLLHFGNTPENHAPSIDWNALGNLLSPIFNNESGCPTMVGPMNTHLKPKKFIAYRRSMKQTQNPARPQQLEDGEAREKADTDKNMAAMFDILRRKKSVKLQNLILNRLSFAQTVENLFALSFLAKDGRVQISVDNNGTHLVSPTNAPDANLVATGDVIYNHFVFRFDFKDWKLMKDDVVSGEEMMPHRYQVSIR